MADAVERIFCVANNDGIFKESNGSVRLSATILGRALVILLFCLATWAVVNTQALLVDVARLEEKVMSIERDIADGKDVDKEQWRRLNGRAADR